MSYTYTFTSSTSHTPRVVMWGSTMALNEEVYLWGGQLVEGVVAGTYASTTAGAARGNGIVVYDGQLSAPAMYQNGLAVLDTSYSPPAGTTGFLSAAKWGAD